MDSFHLTQYVIRPVLEKMGMASLAAERLVLGTACQESSLEYLRQLGGGPGRGLYQMERATHDDIWETYLSYRPDVAAKVQQFEIPTLYEADDSREMMGNLYYATAMCRVHYWRVSEPLPEATDIYALGRYYKQHYNTRKGAATPEEFVRNYGRLGYETGV